MLSKLFCISSNIVLKRNILKDFSVISEQEVFPRHQSLGSVKNSDKELEDSEDVQNKIPVTGEY